MLTDFVAFIETLSPEQINFVSTLTEEELGHLKKIAKQAHNELNPDTGVNKVYALTVVENKLTNNATTAEARNINGLRKLFSEFDKYSGLSDSAFAEVISDSLWAHQGVFTTESAMLESIYDRLKRSVNGALPKINFLIEE